MSQLTTTRTPELGYIGQCADWSDKRVLTRQAAEDINFGDLLTENAAGDEVFKLLQNRLTLTLNADLITGNSLTGTIKYKHLNDTSFTEKTIGPVPFNTDHDTTMNDLKSEIETELATAVAATDVVLSDTVNNRAVQITAQEGYQLEIGATAFVVTGGVSQATVTPSRDTTHQVRGIALHQHRVPPDQNETAKYEKGSAVNLATKGTFWVKPTEATNTNSDVYANFDPTNRGQLRASSGTSPTVATLVAAGAKYRGSAAANELNQLELNQP